MKGIEVTGIKELAVKEYDIPAVKPGYVLLKVKYAGICGSDVDAWKEGRGGVILGHEMVGTVEDAGDSSFIKGERVSLMEFDPCGECVSCNNGREYLCTSYFVRGVGLAANGAYADYVLVKADMVRRIPDSVSDRQAALIEPAAVALHACHIGEVTNGSRVLVTGAGAVGLLCAACAKALGAEYVATTARNENRLEFARGCDFVDEVFDGKDADMQDKLAQKGGFTQVLDCSGAGALITMGAELLNTGGELVVVGAPKQPFEFPYLPVMLKEVQIKGTLLFARSDFEQVIELMAEGKLSVEKLATSIVSFDQAQEYFEIQGSGKSREVKVLLDPAL